VSWEAGAFVVLRLVLTVVGVAVAAVLALKILVVLLEPRVTFMPVTAHPVTPAAIGLPFEDVAVRTDDGVRVHGWFVPAGYRRGSGRAPLTLLFFHGNAENVGDCLPLGPMARRAGYNILLLDYRGYGLSEGRPSEKGIYRDGEAALRYLRSRPDVDPDRIVLWGRSIGAAVAVHLAAEEPVVGVVLESSFTSARELLREGGYWFLFALSLAASYRFDQAAKIGRVSAPILVIHGTDDEIVPIELGRRLYELAPGKKEFLAIEGGGHNDLLVLHAQELWGGVRRFLARLD
jgi:uncharacterized protein